MIAKVFVPLASLRAEHQYTSAKCAAGSMLVDTSIHLRVRR
jgi:hypothetical protein